MAKPGKGKKNGWDVWRSTLLESLANLGDWFGLGPTIRTLFYDTIMGTPEEKFEAAIKSEQAMISFLNAKLAQAYQAAGEEFNSKLSTLPAPVSNILRKANSQATAAASKAYSNKLSHLADVERRISSASSEASTLASYNHSRNTMRDVPGRHENLANQLKDIERKITNDVS